MNDFGFSFEDSKEQEDKVSGLFNMILPLLNNLKSNPEKDTIFWPNRVEKIDAFIKKLQDYINKE